MYQIVLIRYISTPMNLIVNYHSDMPGTKPALHINLFISGIHSLSWKTSWKPNRPLPCIPTATYLHTLIPTPTLCIIDQATYFVSFIYCLWEERWCMFLINFQERTVYNALGTARWNGRVYFNNRMLLWASLYRNRRYDSFCQRERQTVLLYGTVVQTTTHARWYLVRGYLRVQSKVVVW